MVKHAIPCHYRTELTSLSQVSPGYDALSVCGVTASGLGVRLPLPTGHTDRYDRGCLHLSLILCIWARL